MTFLAVILALAACEPDSESPTNDPARLTGPTEPAQPNDADCGEFGCLPHLIITDARADDENFDGIWTSGETLTVTGRLVNPTEQNHFWYPTATLRVLVDNAEVATDGVMFYGLFARTSADLQWTVVLPEGAPGAEVRVEIAAGANCDACTVDPNVEAPDVQVVYGTLEPR